MSKFRASQHRNDSNHEQIVSALRKAGIAVKSLSAVGDGMPDLLCSFRKTTLLLEVKSPGGKLRLSQLEFIANWPGIVKVVTTPEEAVLAVVEAAR